jgi:uncharacterized protein with GYD domain
MPIFITQGRYTQTAITGMMSSHENRAQAVAELYERAGGKMLAFYITFGEYDWISIGELPDHRSDLAVLIAGASKGAVSDLKTTVAVTPEEFALACEDAAKLAPGFKAAGFPPS